METEQLQPQPQTVEDPCTGIEPAFHDIVRKYGRPLFALLANTQMAMQAVQIIGNFAERQKSRNTLQALGILSNILNNNNQAYVLLNGWSTELVDACAKEMRIAASKKIQVASAIIMPPAANQ